ncbi:hypothetical protein CALVIDRAFT_544800 [Calocera viscosa TUFC12733]|uniref:Integrase catalytic domain-containing protein n=1 Tax=Calocera viscosa (strain TUFC12733) TaxID=1330018 RepID=A0A167PCC8_CALVF|nr:hypothetical protein CALVIDRAFT_544800 [Calocera viscosa TUFC12733]
MLAFWKKSGRSPLFSTHTIRRTRQQGHTIESIAEQINCIRDELKPPGIKRTQDWLRSLLKVQASRRLVAEYNRLCHPEEVKQRKARQLKRKIFWAAGLWHLIAFDQHDKWKRFNLWLHIGLEPFSGTILWLKIWWTNKNPRLVFSYYLAMARRYGGIPLLTQSDRGSENNGIAIGHSLLLRREFSPGYEDMLDEGSSRAGTMEPFPSISTFFLLRRLAIPFLQERLDAYVLMYNNSKPRPDKKKIIPVGIPNEIMEYPERWGARNFQVKVTEEDLRYVESTYAPHDHPVFQLVPPSFETRFAEAYAAIGAPPLTKRSFWAVYLALKRHILLGPETEQIMETLASQRALEATMAADHIEVNIEDHESDVDLPILGAVEDDETFAQSTPDLIREVDDLLQPDLTTM